MADYYVSSAAGLDTNSGSSAAPVKTIAKALTLSTVAGDKVWVRYGVYAEEVVIPRANIVIEGVPDSNGRQPIIDGNGVLARGIKTASPNYMLGLQVKKLEIRNFTRAGIDIGGSTTQSSILFGFFGVLFEDLNIHHIILWDVSTQANNGAPQYQDGIRVAGGDPTIRRCNVSYIGQGGEAHGIFLSWCRDYLVDDCNVWAVRKEAIRNPYCLRGEIRNTRTWLSTYGINMENSVSGLVINCYAYQCAAPFVHKHCNNPDLATNVFAAFGLTRKLDANGRMAVYDSANVKQAETRFWHCTGYGSALYHNYVANGFTKVDAAGVPLYPDRDYNVQARNCLFAGYGPMYLFDSLLDWKDGGALKPNHDDTVTYDHNVYSNETSDQSNLTHLYQNGSTPGTTAIDTVAALTAYEWTIGWEAAGRQLPITVADPLTGNPEPTQPITGTLDLTSQGSPYGSQVGARLPAISQRFRKEPAQVIDSSSVSTQAAYDQLTDQFTITGFGMSTGVNEWVVADFGSVRPFRIVRWEPQATVDKNVAAFKIEISSTNNGSDWQQVYTNTFNDGNTAQFVIELDQAYSARYVRFTGINTRGDLLAAAPYNEAGHLLLRQFFFREISFGEFTDVTAPVQTLAPSNTALPVITGTAQVGLVLSCDTGGWLNSPTSFARQWLRDGSTTGMTGQTGATYAAVAADATHLVSCRVTATNAIGGTVATSAAVTVAAAPAQTIIPTNVVAPVISGSAALGLALTVDIGTWANTPTSFTYQWQRDASNISGATGQAYTVVAGDVGHSLLCIVTATNSAGSKAATSAPVTVPVPDASKPPFDGYWGIPALIGA